MKVVNIITGSNPAELERQLSSEASKLVKYTFNQHEVPQSCDLLVIMHRSGLRTAINIRGKVVPKLYISFEPHELKSEISSRFLRQFDYVWASSKHRNENIEVVPTHTWWLGVEMRMINGKHLRKLLPGINHSFLAENEFALPKSDRVLIISSKKVLYDGHKRRADFIERLTQDSRVKDRIDVFGQGYNEFNDKTDLILKYRYVIVMENECLNDYWTEKLADVVLLNREFIYIGCRNITTYFPFMDALSFDDYDEVVNMIANNKFTEKRLSIEAKELVLQKYNILNQLSEFVTNRDLVRGKTLNYLRPNFYYVIRSYRIFKILKNKLRTTLMKLQKTNNV